MVIVTTCTWSTASSPSILIASIISIASIKELSHWIIGVVPLAIFVLKVVSGQLESASRTSVVLLQPRQNAVLMIHVLAGQLNYFVLIFKELLTHLAFFLLNYIRAIDIFEFFDKNFGSGYSCGSIHCQLKRLLQCLIKHILV